MRILPIFRLGLVCATLLAGAAFAAGPRAFPGNSVQVYLNQVGNGYVLANDSIPLKLASGIVIFNERNRTVVRSALPAGVKVRLLLNGKDEIQRLWILAPDEIEDKPSLEPLTRQRTRGTAAQSAGAATGFSNGTTPSTDSYIAP